MENFDFDGSSEIIKPIEVQNPPSVVEPVFEEKKVVEPQMMEFSSSVADLMPVASQDVYTNPTNGRVAALSLPTEPTPQKKGTQNPFNLTDEQMNALIAGVVAVAVFSTTVQTKIAGMVPNFSGINGTIANVLLAAVLYYFALRFIKNR